MRVLRTSLLAVVLVLCGLSSAGADELVLQSIANEPPNSPEGVLRPTKGMTMAQVEQRFGVPARKDPPVGKPPITRWDYGRFVVYFEYQHVIHSVVKRGK